MKPLFARVILERDKLEKVGSILIPKDAERRLASLRCRVLAAGPTCEPNVKELVGKDVLIGRHAGDWINEDGVPGLPEGKEYFIVQEEDILAELE